MPHESPKGIACCADVDLCNEHIEPTIVYRSTTLMPGCTYIGLFYVPWCFLVFTFRGVSSYLLDQRVA